MLTLTNVPNLRAVIRSLTAAEFETPIGPFTILCSEERVIRTLSRPFAEIDADPEVASLPAPKLVPAKKMPAAIQVMAYFAGKRQEFDLEILLSARTFDSLIYSQLVRIPYGQVVTYGQLAEMAGYPGAARAAGGAMRRSPMDIILPCHRVIAAGRRLGGYGSTPALLKKKMLLEMEGVTEAWW